MGANNLFLITDTTSGSIMNDNSVVPVQYHNIHTSANLNPNGYVPVDLLNNFITNYSPTQLTFLPQGPAPHSGMAGLRMDK